MAVEFHNEYGGQWLYKRGTLEARFFTLEAPAVTSNLWYCAVAVKNDNGLTDNVRLLASTAEHYADIHGIGTVTFTGDAEGVSSSPALIGPGGTIPPIAQWIDADTKDDAVDRTITERANEVPWFHFTNATLYAKLRQLYPDFHSFCITSASGSPGATYVPNPYVSPINLNSNYNFSEGLIGLMDYCDDAPGVSGTFDVNVVYGGHHYGGRPLELEGEWSNIYALGAYFLLADPDDERKCIVDFYFNGNKEPNISISYESVLNGEPSDTDDILRGSKLHIINFAPADIQQPPFTAYYTYIDDQGYRQINDLVYNQVRKEHYIYPCAPAGSKDTSYLSQVDAITGDMATAAKILAFGPNELPEHLVWIIQCADEDNNHTSMWILEEPRESEGSLAGYTLTEFTDAEYPSVALKLEVYMHDGTNPGDTQDDPPGPPPLPPDPDPDDWDDDEGHGFPGDAVLTKTYAMTAAVLQNIGQKLWSQSYFDVLKIQNNPIENVVAVKWFPFDLTGTRENVKVGNVDFGIEAQRINSVRTIDIGSCTYTGKYGNYLDGSPYTQLKLNLPYIGQIELDASEFLGKTIGVKYIVDLVTGECVARVSRAGIPLYDFPGHMGVDIVLTSTDRMQANLKAVQTGIHTAANMAGHLMGEDLAGAAVEGATGALSIAGMDYNSQRVGSPSGVCGSFQNHKVWLTVIYPLYYESEGFTRLLGRPCNKYLSLNNFRDGDFVQVDRRTDIKVAMTSDENAELEKLLVGGIYI